MKNSGRYPNNIKVTAMHYKLYFMVTLSGNILISFLSAPDRW